ncbi:MAG: DoxX family protein, partial [Saprospiraceae bacterium]|nr:DoxX family protein [Saprospiraceae bacterium]
MTLGTLVLWISIVALILTAVIGLVYKSHKSWLMTFLQNFTGVLFIFSGFVKAIDPLGTAFKMEQYFAEFEGTLSATWMSFIAPMFPWLSEHSAVFSVIMIVFEIILGIMLLLGAKPKLTAWLFLLLVVFFTILTGFTYLTGYVPSGVNFFEFGKWGPYVATNMKVTDCGCFGDFLVLEPKVSFMKDVVLLLPALFFVFRHKDMHELFSKRFRTALLWVITFGITLFCMNNFVWNLPPVDFRPFYVGQNIKETKEAEMDAQANVEIVAYKMTNKASGDVVEIPFDQYMKEFKKYPKEEWELEQVKSEPAIKSTKISDFELSNLAGEDATEELLGNPEYNFLIVSYKIPFELEQETISVQDTMWRMDTTVVEGFKDRFLIERNFDLSEPREETVDKYIFDSEIIDRYRAVVNPLIEKAKAGNVQVNIASAYAAPKKFEDFKAATGTDATFYTGDD